MRAAPHALRPRRPHVVPQANVQHRRPRHAEHGRPQPHRDRRRRHGQQQQMPRRVLRERHVSPAGTHLSVCANSSTISVPATNTGTASPTLDPAESARSSQDPRRSAAAIPAGTPNPTANSAAAPISSSVRGSRRRISTLTGLPSCKLSPRSPCSSRRKLSRYCEATDPSNPSCSRSAATLAGSGAMPPWLSSSSAGSPGTKRIGEKHDAGGDPDQHERNEDAPDRPPHGAPLSAAFVPVGLGGEALRR